MVLFIKNMVCDRCKTAVQVEFNKLNLHPNSIQLGEVTVDENLPAGKLSELNAALKKIGFELIDNKQRRIIEKIKNTIIDIVHYAEEPSNLKHSEIISEALHYDYPYLSKLFSEVEGVTIEQYLIRQKIEKVKELLVYEELTLNEISYRLGYSSIAHLSAQFKKVTGLPPSHFKNVGLEQRKSIDKVS